ncbi:trans-resveratrol di-O-methyltransferase-like [Phoenix dactylifera]|uniref:Trans-resveratrol di-O-methyltransferase-like n=1 Tax=Phoenix dactylifera TaxID=42345 RepID=A0A8B7BJK7_PHODC|nr:trans-resveratrol di-O-methyltransferase-like [Phoenix dactylifera]
MEGRTRGEDILEELEAQGNVWNHTFKFVTSMSLKCAVELGIPDAIHSHGGPVTLSELAAMLSLPPGRTAALRRLMRMLVHSGCFSKCVVGDGKEDTYVLTLFSKLLLKAKRTSVSAYVLGMLDPLLIQTWHSLSAWFHGEERTPFRLAHGKDVFEAAAERPELAAFLNAAMASDSQLVGEVMVRECSEAFKGVKSLVDVGGCTGTMAMIIAEAFPDIKCTVFDLPHIVAAAAAEVKTPATVDFVGGDMFERVPPADVALLKWVLHDWSDDDCVKILRRCKGAIPSKENGGKLIIVDMVVKAGDDGSNKSTETQLFFDMLMMVVSGGMQRDEEGWRKIFLDAGFSGYKIKPVMGLRSIIEVYP